MNFRYRMKNYVSDVQFSAKTLDPSLINPIGATIVDDTIWIANNGSSVITNYTLHGKKLPNQLTEPNGNPTGIVKYSGDKFIITSGNNSGPSKLIMVTDNGTIDAWNPQVDPNIITVINN